MAKIRLGLIGCGGMGESHQRGLQALSDQVTITCVCDIIPERAQAAAALLGGPLAFTDYKDMVEHVDAVVIALPHELHFEVGAFFIRRGIHVLMEKPLCITEYECRTLIDAADAHGVTLMTAYPVRYWPAVRKLKELVDSGEYGQLFHMSIWTEQYTKGAVDWYNTIKGLGGGQLFSHGCHYIDILLWFLGRPVKGFHLGTRLGTPWMEREGTSDVAIIFESGAVGYHMGTWGARGTHHGYDFQLHLTGGMLEYDHQQKRILLYRNMMKSDLPQSLCREEPEIIWEAAANDKQTEFEIAHFVDCIVNHRTPETDARGSLQGLRVIWRLYDAEERGVVADLRGLGLDEWDD